MMRFASFFAMDRAVLRRGAAVLALVTLGAVPAGAGLTPVAEPAAPSAGGVLLAQVTALPGGATSLREEHGDWVVACGLPSGTVACTLSQQQTDNRSNQRVLAVELSGRDGGATAVGTIVMPFGLALDQGLTLQIDEGQPTTVSFGTCVPAGCLAPVTFQTELLDALRRGTTLKLRVIAYDTGNPVDFTVSLKGFSESLNRTVELAGG
jgi:invasion protein IalB